MLPHLIFVGRGKVKIRKYGTVMNFPNQNLNGEQLKHRNIVNEILWIYSSTYEPLGACIHFHLTLLSR